LISVAFSVSALPRVSEGFEYNAGGPTFGALAAAADAVPDWARTGVQNSALINAKKKDPPAHDRRF
jgi:hypothetical protein